MENPSEAPGTRFRGAPLVPQAHVFEVEGATQLLVANGSRLYQVSDSETAERLRRAAENRDARAMDQMLVELGLDESAYVEDRPPSHFPTRAISLAIAQKCNLGCTYCYAEGGDFGGSARNMSEEVAIAAVNRLITEAPQGSRVNIAFLGGEPLANRRGLVAATEYAVELGRQRGVTPSFSITTNGTLVTDRDAAFFARHGFAVTVSLDGLGAAHDRQRPFKNGRGSFARVCERVLCLLDREDAIQVSARVTVTPRNLALRATLEGLLGFGFRQVGFAPMLSSPTGVGEMGASELAEMLEQMIDCGLACEERLLAGRPYGFTNLHTALREIHKGTHRPYSCGAGGPYLGVSADGGLYACHRFVDSDAGRLGDVEAGVSAKSQGEWLARRHIRNQVPCSSCWARYLCGGGCHHEVINRGRPACDYIRGWLDYCLGAYVRIAERRPGFFDGAGSAGATESHGD